MPGRSKQIAKTTTSAEQEIATLDAREERIRLALSAGHIYTLDWDIEADSIVWSEGLEKELLISQPPGDVASFRALVHPDDVDFVSKRIQAAIQGPNSYDAEFRMVRSDGSVRWTSARAIVVRDDSGRAVRMVGVDQDVTERHELLRRTTESEARLRACHGSLAAAETASKMGSWDWDISADRVYVSDAYRALYGLDPDVEVTFDTWLNLILPEDREKVLRSTQRHLETGSPLDIEFRINHPTGGIRWVAGLGQATRDDNGTPTRFAGVNIDVTDRKRPEAAPPDREEVSELEAIYEAAPVGLCVLSLDLRWIRINAKMAETNGIPAEDHIGRSVYELTPGIAEPVAATVRHVAETGETFSGELTGETPARPGVRRTWLSTYRPIRNSAERIAAVLVIAEEITEARAGEEQRRHLVRLVEASNALIALAASDGRVTYINRPGRRMVGLAEDAPLDDVVFGDSVAPAWRDAFFGEVLPTVRDAGVWVGEMQLVNRVTGRQIDVHRSIFALHDHEGKFAGYGTVMRDITDAKASQTALTESEAKLRSVLESTTDSVFALSPDWRFTFLNRRAIAQIPRLGDAIGRRYEEVFPDRVGTAPWDAYQRCMTNRAPAEAESTYEGRRYVARAFPSEDGGITVFFRDVSEERTAEARIAAAEGMVRMLGDSTPDLFFAKDRDCRLIYANRATLAVIGRDAPDVIGRSEAEWASDPAQGAAVMESDRRIMQTGVGETVEDIFFDAVRGEDRIFQSTKEPLRDPVTGAVIGIVGVARDITEQRRTEQALAESEARLRLATQAGGVGVFDWDVRTGEIKWDERMRELWALPAGVDVRLDTFFASLHPDDREWVEAANLAALDPAGSGHYEAEYRIIGATDGQERRVAARGKVTFENGAATRMVGTVVDRTALRMAEAVLARDRAELEALVAARTQDLQQTQARLAQAEKLTALGQLAGGVAHDFNNVLQAVLGGARLIDRKPEDPDNVRRLARMVLDAAERGSAVSHRLLSFARQGDLRATPVDPASLLDKLQEVLAHTLGAGVAIQVHAAADLPPMFVDKGQLETVLINLAANARDGGDGRPDLRGRSRSGGGKRPGGDRHAPEARRLSAVFRSRHRRRNVS